MPNKPANPDPAVGWKFVEKVLREGDVERLGETTDEEVERQLHAAGVELERIPTVDELFAKATERARKREEEGIGSGRVSPLPARPKRST